MSATLVSSNTTLKYTSNLSSGATVPANSYAIATYVCVGTYTNPGSTYASTTPYGIFQVYYGAGQTVAASVQIGNGPSSAVANANFLVCICFTNTP
jgi:hypothetical protein